MKEGIAKLLQQQKLAVGFGGSGVMDSPVGWIGTESGEPGFQHIWSTDGAGAGDPNSPVWTRARHARTLTFYESLLQCQ